MGGEKQQLIEETAAHLAKSDYVYLTHFDRLTAAETAELRESLLPYTAEFHVVKNRLLKRAVKQRGLPVLSEQWLKGPTAIVVGGTEPAGIAKTLVAFSKERLKLTLKGGLVGNRLMEAPAVEALSKLPGLEVLQAQLLGALMAPAQKLVQMFIAAPQSLLRVLQARN